MINDKIIPLENYRKPKKNINMFFLAIFIGAFVGLASWHYFVENVAATDVAITPSQNINFNLIPPISMTTGQIANEFERADGKPILLYVYTTWCKVCTQNFAAINEIAREFQATDLQVLTLAIDRDIDEATLQSYLNSFGKLYFQPRFLSFKEGFIEFLQKKNISYGNRIPFTVLIARDGEVVTKFTGTKGKNYLRNKVIKQL